MLRLVCFFAGLLFCACATGPSLPVERALYDDLNRIVQSRVRTGWYLDRAELEAIASAAMYSGCQVAPESRAELLRWLEARSAALGGPAREAYLARGRDLDAVEELLALERTTLALRYVIDHAEQECPFWLEEDVDFRGVQGEAERFVIVAESMGNAGLFVRSDSLALTGGGTGRLLFGAGLDHHWTLAIGGELGATAAYARDAEGERKLEGALSVGIPALIRLHDGLRMYDIDLALTTRIDDGEGLRLPPGFRVTTGVGLAALRIGPFMPAGVLFIGYEYQPPRDGLGADHILRFGTRVGVHWDP